MLSLKKPPKGWGNQSPLCLLMVNNAIIAVRKFTIVVDQSISSFIFLLKKQKIFKIRVGKMLNIGFLYVSRVLQTYIKTLKFQYVAVVEFYIHYNRQ